MMIFFCTSSLYRLHLALRNSWRESPDHLPISWQALTLAPMSPLTNLESTMELLLASHCRAARWLVSLDARAQIWTLSEFMSMFNIIYDILDPISYKEYVMCELLFHIKVPPLACMWCVFLSEGLLPLASPMLYIYTSGSAFYICVVLHIYQQICKWSIWSIIYE